MGKEGYLRDSNTTPLSVLLRYRHQQPLHSGFDVLSIWIPGNYCHFGLRGNLHARPTYLYEPTNSWIRISDQHGKK